MTIDAKAALTESPASAVIAVGVVGAGAIAWTAILGALGIDSDFFKSSGWPEPKFTAGIVPMLLLAFIVASTAAAAVLTVKAYVKAMLSDK